MYYNETTTKGFYMDTSPDNKVPVTVIYASKRELLVVAIAATTISYLAYSVGRNRVLWKFNPEMFDRK